ncbi:Os01g0549450 [Oryza sativa Japonica Group]|uniref:Os01g0549450 protein n=1 Tax=Oryza sativa subsp. japonica TaxID=39947 RepID=A0A0P0V3W1_ORYSJ|nr:Os01g0549450 [Oryza sativa Japonica Group]
MLANRRSLSMKALRRLWEKRRGRRGPAAAAGGAAWSASSAWRCGCGRSDWSRRLIGVALRPLRLQPAGGAGGQGSAAACGVPAAEGEGRGSAAAAQEKATAAQE